MEKFIYDRFDSMELITVPISFRSFESVADSRSFFDSAKYVFAFGQGPSSLNLCDIKFLQFLKTTSGTSLG